MGRRPVRFSTGVYKGRLKMDEWGNDEGEPRRRLLITAENINFLDKPKEKSE